MPPIRLVTDSTSDLSPEYRRDHGVVAVPLKVIFGDDEFSDGVDIDAPAFYARMRASSRNPTTSQPTPAEFEAAFREAGAGGAGVVCTTISSEMSGTHQAAVAAREAVPELDVHVIDTRTVAIGHGSIARAAVERIEAGADLEEVLATIEHVMARQRALFTVPTLEYLRRGGRIGGAQAFLGSVLSIKPILQIHEGRVDAYDRVRTTQRALDRMVAEVASAAGETGVKQVVLVGHGDRLEDAERVAERLAPHSARAPEVCEIGPIVGCHAGPDTIGIAFCPPAP